MFIDFHLFTVKLHIYHFNSTCLPLRLHMFKWSNPNFDGFNPYFSEVNYMKLPCFPVTKATFAALHKGGTAVGNRACGAGDAGDAAAAPARMCAAELCMGTKGGGSGPVILLGSSLQEHHLNDPNGMWRFPTEPWFPRGCSV